MAETASVFGEALTFKRLLAFEEDPAKRLNLLAGRIEDSIATVFRQICMNRFEDAVHTERRERASCRPTVSEVASSETQGRMFDDSVDLDGYGTWWSYPHFLSTPGYVYAYAYGFLFALSIFRKYELDGDAMVGPYLELLRSGGSKPPGARRDRRPRPRRSRPLGQRDRRALQRSSTRRRRSQPRSASAARPSPDSVTVHRADW